MADLVTTSNTQETETSAAPNSLPLGENEAETCTDPNTLPPREHDAAGEEVGTEPMPDNPHEPQKSQQATDPLPLNERKAKNDDSNTTEGEYHPEGQQAPAATPTETQAGESSGSDTAGQEPKASTTGDGTGVKEPLKDPQTVAKDSTDELEPQDGPGKDPLPTADGAMAASHSATKDRAGSTSGPPINTPATNPATGPSAAEDIDPTKSNEELIDAAKYEDAGAVTRALHRRANIVATNDAGETAIHLAARYDNLDAFTAILEVYKTRPLDINIRDDDGWTPLYSAAGSASKELVSMILDMKGVDLKAKNSSGQTPLYAACYSGNIDAVKLLLGTKVGPDTIEMANEDGWTPLHAACSRGELDVVRLLLDNSAKIDRRDLQRRTPLHIASAEGRDKVAEYLLSRQETLIHMTDLNSQTALHSATSNSQWSDRFDVVQVLVNKGAKVDLLDSEGCTALILSCRSLRYRRATEADESTVRRLADMTKNINHMDNEGYTALDWAIDVYEDKLVQILLEKKADPDVKRNDNKWSVLRRASYRGSDSLVQLLLNNGAKVNFVGKDFWSALHQACDEGEDKVVDILLRKGADSTIRTRDTGEIPLHLAARNGYDKVVLLLLDPSLNPNMDVSVRTAKDETALHLAARKGHNLVIRVLLDAGSDPSATTSDEVTVLGLAGRGETEGHQKAIKMISTALDPPKRKDALLDCYGLEDKATLARLVEFLDWTELEKLQVVEEGDLIWLAARKEKDNHDIVLLRLREKYNKKIQPVSLPPAFNKETSSALQYATYLGDWNIVWWLLYSGWSKEMERDRDGALKIAKWCDNQLSGTGAKAMAMKEQKHDTKRTGMPESGLPAESAQSTNDKKGQDKKDKIKKTNEDKNKEVEKKKNDYPSIIDTLRDPPVRDADIVRGWSETDDLYQTPEIDKAVQQAIELFDGTIVDFYRSDGGSDTRLDFLRRTRSVWDIVYGEPKRPDPAEKEAKSADRKETTVASTDKLLEEAHIYGPRKIMEAARNKLGKTGSNSMFAKQKVYTEKDLQFRWIHLPANNLEWMMDLTKRIYCDKTKTQEDFRGLTEFIRQSLHELRGNKPYMRPSCTKEHMSMEKNSDLEKESGEVPQPVPSPITDNPQADTPSLGKEDSPGSPQNAESQKSEIPKYWRLALYMPYLTFATYRKPDKKLDDKQSEDKKLEDTKPENKEPKDKNEELSNAYPPYDNGRNGSKSEAKNDWKVLHESRTLDQFYYHSLKDTTERDASQVITRYVDNLTRPKPSDRSKLEQWEILRSKLEQWEILRVDQLWLWVIDEKTIITSSTNRLDDREDPVIEDIFNYLKEAKGKKKGQPPPSSVDEMSKFITTFCIDQIDKSTCNCMGDELSARQIFANSINDAANSETKLFEKFHDKIKEKLKALEADREAKNRAKLRRHPTQQEKDRGSTGTATEGEAGKEEDKSTPVEARTEQEKEVGSISTTTQAEASKEEDPTDQEKDYRSISTATELLLEVKDMRDELNILNYLLTQQKIVWEKLLGLSVNEDGSIRWNETLQRETEKWKGPWFALKDVIEMDKIAQRIQDSVNSILGLEQNEANISEAESTRKQTQVTIEQGRTLMVFTVITIVFLPMSFLASLFALNITSFPHKGDNLLYEPRFIFSIIFGITAAIAMPTIGYARYKKKFLELFSWLFRILGITYAISMPQKVFGKVWPPALAMAQKFFSKLRHAIKSSPPPSSEDSPPQIPPPRIPPGDAATKENPERKPRLRSGLDEVHSLIEIADVNVPNPDKPTQKQSNVKEVSASSSQKADEQPEKGEFEEQHSHREKIRGFFRHPLGNHPSPSNHRVDEEKALKK